MKPNNFNFALFKPLLHQLLQDFYYRFKLPSLSFAFINSDTLINFTSFGSIQTDSQIPPTPQTIFESASTAKAFTCIMLLQLRNKGLLSLDDPIKMHLSDTFSENSGFLSGFGDSTLRNLASHSAGLPQEGDFDRWDADQMENFKAINPDIQLEKISENYEGFHYSNIGYILLGAALEKVAKRSYQEYVIEEILKPLGMNDSGFGGDFFKNKRNAAKGYLQNDKKLEPAPMTYFKEGDPSGGLKTTVEDLAKYLQFLMKNDNPKVLKSNRELLNPCVLYHPTKNLGRKLFKSRAYGLGINIGDYNEEYQVYYHSGGLPGFRSYWLMVPELNFSIILWQNSDHPGIRIILEEVLDLLISGFKKSLVEVEMVQRKIKQSTIYKHFLGEIIVLHIMDDDSMLMDCKDMSGADIKGIKLQRIGQGEKYRVADGSDFGEILELIKNKKMLQAIKYKGRVFHSII